MNFPVFFIILFIFTMINKVNLVDWRHVEQVHDKSFGFLIQAGYRPEAHVLAKYVASLQFEYKNITDKHFCGGTIIKSNIILTAAHCITFKAEYIRVIVGSVNRLDKSETAQVMKVEKIIVHPYARSYLGVVKNDVALLVLKKDISIDGESTAIMETIDKPIVESTHCIAAGWGRLFSNGPSPAEILYVNLSTLEPKDCKRESGLIHRKGMICVHDESDPEKGVNSGDSGGPLICDNKVVGIASFIFMVPGNPDIYADVYEYRDWILANMSPHLKSELILVFGLIIFKNLI